MAGNDIDITFDLTYAVCDKTTLTLDLYRPRSSTDTAVVVYLHGGGWQAGDKRDGALARLEPLARAGLAVASINYRLAPTATYPAPIHDAKAAVRWLRANGSRWGLAVERIGIWGASAGGYLAIMTGLTAADQDLEGELGEHLDQSSAVQAVVSWFAPSDPVANASRTWLEQILLESPSEKTLFGIDEITAGDERITVASPVHRAHASAPPFLLAHGDRDRIVGEQHSRLLHDALTRAGASSTLTVLGGAGHEDPAFDTPAHLQLTAAWLRAQLTPPRSSLEQVEGISEGR